MKIIGDMIAGIIANYVYSVVKMIATMFSDINYYYYYYARLKGCKV